MSLRRTFAITLSCVNPWQALECMWLSAYIAYDAGGDSSRQARGPHKFSTMRAQRNA
jgi:hypothetical protein